MSVFIEILRCLLCFDDEEFETLGRNTRYRVDNNRLYAPLTRESDARTTTPTPTPQIHSPPVSNFVKPYSTVNSLTQPKSTSSVVIKQESSAIRTPHKSFEEASPSPYPSYQNKAINSADQRLAQPSPSLSKLVSSLSSPPPPPSSSSSSKTPSFPKPVPPSTKPTLCPAPSTPTKSQAKNNYILVVKDKSPYPSYQNKAINSSDQRLAQPSPSLSKLESSLSLPPPPPSSSSSSSSSKTPPSFPKPVPPSTKPTLCPAPSTPTKSQAKNNYILVDKGKSPLCPIPEDLKDLFKKDVVPGILKRRLSTSTYTDFFDTLLYAEDFYIEKWDGFEMENVTLKLHEAAIYQKKGKYTKLNVNDEKDEKVFVEFEINSIPERRPFLLSRDFVTVRPSANKAETFQGLIYRVVKSNLVLVEFGEDFHYQHYSACKYDIKFSFNRVCLKRAHQAMSAASDPLFSSFLFPEFNPQNSLVDAPVQFMNSKLDRAQISVVRQILCHKNPPPYLVEGPISVDRYDKQLSRTGLVICEAVFQIYRMSSSSRILICAPTNSTCDVITRSLKKLIPESDMFRANAAFREWDGVPFDILTTCLYKREQECFSCPSLQELRNFRVILSTFMSSFRLRGEGVIAGHFSHIFLVDASSTTEPEVMVALANLANERTNVVMTGEPGNRTTWIRSNIARQNGLMVSYFERLRKSQLYASLDSKLITKL